MATLNSVYKGRRCRMIKIRLVFRFRRSKFYHIDKVDEIIYYNRGIYEK